MGRELQRQDSETEFQRFHQGCMWSIFHILDHHNLHGFKKRPPRRKAAGAKRDICCTNPKTVSFNHFHEEIHEYLDAEAVPLLVEPETSPPTRLSGNSQALPAKEISARPPLNRTTSVHHLEPSDGRFPTRNTNWGNPIIILHRSADDSRELFKQEQKSSTANSHSQNRNFPEITQLDRGISCPQFDYLDVLEIFKVNKKLFMEVQEGSEIKPSLKKSGSFPGPVNLRPITLEHKQKEVWYFRNPEHCSPETSEDSSAKSQVLKPDTICQDRSLPQEFSEVPQKHGWPHWHHSVAAQIRYIKRRIKRVIGESRMAKKRISRNAVHQRDSAEDEHVVRTMETSAERAGMRRTSSLNESMDRYARLFESSVSRETKWSRYQSKSLRLINDDKAPRIGNGPKSFRRRLSLSDLDTFVPYPNEVFRDAFSAELPKGCDIETNVPEVRPQEEVLENSGGDEWISRKIEVYDDEIETEKTEQRPVWNQEICSDGRKQQEPDTELLVSDCSITANESVGESDNIITRECDEITSVLVENHGDFSYVRSVLDLAGFNDQNCVGKWHSLDQPISSTLFKKIECSSGDADTDSDHRLLFDLINEELLDIYESSLAYFPEPFSATTRRLKRLPEGNRLVEEVCRRIETYQKSYTEEQSLDDIVGRDLENQDGWMKLLFDVEDVALDLEDSIFEEILDEVICS